MGCLTLTRPSLISALHLLPPTPPAQRQTQTQPKTYHQISSCDISCPYPSFPKQFVRQDTVPVYRFEHGRSMERRDVHIYTFIGWILSMAFYYERRSRSIWRRFSASGVLRWATGSWRPWTLPTANIVGEMVNIVGRAVNIVMRRAHRVKARRRRRGKEGASGTDRP